MTRGYEWMTAELALRREFTRGAGQSLGRAARVANDPWAGQRAAELQTNVSSAAI